MGRRQQTLIWAGLALAGAWLLAWGGYTLASSRKVTVERIQAYVNSVDLSRLSPRERARAIQRLAELLNALSFEERRRTRLEGTWRDWFRDMTEEEKAQFIEATLPTGFRRMITAFEQLPPDKRRRALDEAVKRLRDARRQAVDPRAAPGGTNLPPLSAELQARVTTLGLQAFYSQSSAQTKAELAPLLEELQRLMQSGRLLHGPPGR